MQNIFTQLGPEFSSYFERLALFHETSKELAIYSINFVEDEITFDLIDLQTKTLFCAVKLSHILKEKKLFEKLNHHSQFIFLELWAQQPRP